MIKSIILLSILIKIQHIGVAKETQNGKKSSKEESR